MVACPSLSDSGVRSKEQSSLLNSCYLFQLELEGMRLEEGTDSGADSDFLMELMEINEALDDARTPEKASEIGRDTKGKRMH